MELNSIQAYPPKIWWNKIASEKQTRLETGGEGETLKQMTDNVTTDQLYDRRGNDVELPRSSKVDVQV